MTEQLKVDVAFGLTLDTEFGHGLRYDSEGEPYSASVTLGDLVVQEAARQLAAKLTADEQRYRTLRTLSADRIRELIDERIQPMLDEAFAAPIPLTNTYGEPTGKTKTLREMVIDTAREVMNRRTDSYGRNKSVLETKLEEVTIKVVSKELQGEIDAQKAQIRSALKDSAASVLAAAMAKQAGV